MMRMKLETYLREKKLTDAAFAVEVSSSQSQISRIRRGVSSPSWDLADRIAKATKGKVTANDLIKDRPKAKEAELVG